MTISVIIPVYNGEKYLTQAVESVLRQPYKKIRVIIVNDGSTDNTLSVCNHLSGKDNRITVINKPNCGVSSARNAGIEYVLASPSSETHENEYIAFLDADDKWNNNIITENFAEGKKAFDVIVFGSVYANESLLHYSAAKKYPEKEYSNGHKLLFTFSNHFGAKLYSLKILEQYGIRFIDGLKYNEDKIFQLQCLFFAEKIESLPQVLHIYRSNPVSAMHQIRQIAPADYYFPMINAWEQSDMFLNSFSKKTNKTCTAGTVLASIYVLEILTETAKISCKQFVALFKEIKSSPYYDLLLNMRKKDVSKNQYASKTFLLSHRHLFLLKYRLIGIINRKMAFLLSVPTVRKIYEARKYPYNFIPE